MEKTEHAGSPEGRLNAMKPRPLATQTQGPVEGKRPSFEFRGFDFFAKRDFNELKIASDAYFAPKAKRISRALGPASWLRDPTPPASPEPPEIPEEGAPEGRFANPPEGRNPPAKRRSLCGLKKSRFWLLVGLLVLLILVVIGVGVGVGVTRHSTASATSADPASSSSSPSTTSPGVPTSADGATPSATPTESGSSPTTTTPAVSPPAGTAGKLDCPAANGTTYQVPGSDKRFQRICGVDYSGDGGVELTHVPTQSMLDCMTNCAGTYGCVGAGWGYQDGDVGYEHQCWMKSKLVKPRDVALDWSFAILLQ